MLHPPPSPLLPHPTCTELALNLGFTSQCTPELLSHSACCRLGGGCGEVRGLPFHRRRALQAGGSVKSRGGKFHLRSCFLQTGRGALGIEATLLSSAAKWSWRWRGGAEQAPRSNLGEEKKESEANRNRTVPVCRCNLT